MGKYHYYNDTSTCDRCGRKLPPGCKEYNKDRKWTGRWLCINCYEKLRRDRRKGDLNPYTAQAKGDLFEELTCRWRGVKNLNIENDNFQSPIDHSRDDELGIIDTTGRFCTRHYDRNRNNEIWPFTGLERKHDKEFDNIICYCASEDGKIIERIYIFPYEIVLTKNSIGIFKSSKSGWYERFRIIDENILKKVNELWKKIIGD